MAASEQASQSAEVGFGNCDIGGQLRYNDLFVVSVPYGYVKDVARSVECSALNVGFFFQFVAQFRLFYCVEGFGPFIC